MRLPATALAALVLVAAAPAVAQTSSNSTPAAVPDGRYAVEPSHTRILFSVSHMGFTTWYGNFTGASGTLDLTGGAQARAVSVDVSAPTASVSTTNAKLDGELKAADWLDAAKYPTIRFVARSMTRGGARTAEVKGELTLHGVTRPVTLHATFNGAGINPLDHHYTVGFNATGTIKRSDFGVNKYVPLVGDEVEIILSAAFEKAGG